MGLVRLENIKKYFPLKRFAMFGKGLYVKAVDGVSFTIEKGQVVGLVGESGSGKSTLGYVLAGLEKPTSGRILLEGIDISRKVPRELRGAIQIVFQDPRSSFDPRIKVIDSIIEPLITLRKTSKEEAVDRALNIGELVGLDEDVLKKFPHELSGGQIQRAAIARALITNPKLIVLDEPTSALDVSLRSQILNLLMQIKRKIELTYLIISHDIFTIGYMSDKILTMYAGKIVEELPASDILHRPLHPYTISLITSTPIPDPRLKGRRKFILQGEPPNLINPPSGCRFHPRCPFVTEKCTKEEPPLIEISRDRKVACHYVDIIAKEVSVKLFS